MSILLDENINSGTNSSNEGRKGRYGPMLLLLKAGAIIYVCELVITYIIENIDFSRTVEIILNPIFLTIITTLLLFSLLKPVKEGLNLSREAEKKLDLFRSLIDKSNDSIFIIDPQTARIMDANYKACIALGYGRPELLKKTIMDIGEQITDKAAWEEYVSKARNYGYMLAERYKRKDGTSFPVEMNASIVKIAKQEYMVAVVRDTIERENARIMLEESETIRKLAECAKDAIIMMGGNHEITFWNPAAERIFGYSNAEAIGKHLHMLLAPKRFKDDYQKGLFYFRKTGLGNAIGKTVKLAAVRKNGEEFDIELSVNSVHLGGKWHAVGIIRDLSENKGREDLIKNKEGIISN